MKKTDICEICKANLVLVTNTEDYKKIDCNYCGKTFETNIFCPNNHYICDSCHSKKGKDVIIDFCTKTTLKNPFKIADRIMVHPSFKMYGPEHHIVVPASVLTALKNNNCKNQNYELMNNKDILESIRRGSKIPGGWCGFYGNCGGGVGAGIALSVFSKATPSTDHVRTLANKATALALSKIADDKEHCCKRSVRYGIEAALEIINQNFDCNLKFSTDKCCFSLKNDKCEKENCPFY